MALSAEGKIGIGLGLVFGFGAGAGLVWPEAKTIGWITMVFAFWGLVALAAHHFLTEQRSKTLKFLYPLMGTFFIVTAGAILLFVGQDEPRAEPQEPVASVKLGVDPHAFCFIGFDGYHNDQSMALTAEIHNQNKEAVEFTLMAANFSLDGYPVPAQIEAKHETLFPEEHLVKEDSTQVRLGRDFPGGTQFHGQVDFLARYGPDAANTALLKVRGTVTITLGPTGTRTADLKWAPAPDSLPDCSQEILAAYDKLRTPA